MGDERRGIELDRSTHTSLLALLALLAGCWGDGPADDADAGTSDAGTAQAVCGNQVAEGSEECDGVDLRGLDPDRCSLVDTQFVAGSFSCADDCTFDTSACKTQDETVCGDGIIDAPWELCDPASDFIGFTCLGQGYLAGEVECGNTCRTIDTGGCTGGCRLDVLRGRLICQ